MKITNPQEFEEKVKVVAGATNVGPAKGLRFNADLQTFRLDSVGLFIIRANSFAVTIEPPHDFFSVNIPLNLPFHARTLDGEKLFVPGDAYLLHENDQLSLTAAEGCQLLVGTFFRDAIQEYVSRVNQSEEKGSFIVDPKCSLSTPSGIKLQRTMATAWSKVCLDRSTVESGGWLEEVEDHLVSCFLQAVDTRTDDNRGCGGREPGYMKIAEDFLCANLEVPVTRDRLAEVAGVSMRTLSRAFLKRYGMGPIGFLKERRLDAAYRNLLGAPPGTTSVTNVAMRYGFVHMGKFSIAYRRAFGEMPSTSLSR
jgi:AraC-like DNA-binding protein